MEHLSTWKIFPMFLKVKMKPSPRKAGSDVYTYICIFVYVYMYIYIYLYHLYHTILCKKHFELKTDLRYKQHQP